MKHPKKSRRFSFLLDLFMGQHFTSAFRTSVSSKANGEKVIEFPQSGKQASEQSGTQLLSIYDFPDYLELNIHQEATSLNQLKAPLYRGFSIDLNLFENHNDYLKQILNAKKRSHFRAVMRRFEHCIEPEYKVYQGSDLSSAECDELMLRLEYMLEERFVLKRETNYELPLMKYYREVLFPLLQQRKANLYVIYDGARAISISMNLVMGKTLLLFNSSYDKDYTSFELGHINMLKHIEWAFEQGFERIDLGRGDYFHKRRWVNQNYTYLEIWIGFQGSVLRSIRAFLKIIFLHLRYRTIEVLKFFGLHRLYGFLRKQLYSWQNGGRQPSGSQLFSPVLIPANNIDKTSMTLLDFSAAEHSPKLAMYITLLHRNRFTKSEIKPYIQENKPGQLYVEKEDRIYRVVREGEIEQKN